MQKILIVDDIATNRKLLKQTLVALKDYDIVEASNGIEAIERYKEDTPDLILMDINMPEMDGRQSTTAIKALMGDNYTPIIFVTALTAEDSLASALASGGDDFISKPFNISVLESKINAHLRIRELTQQLTDKNELLISHNQHLTHEQELIEHFFENALQQSFLDNKYIKYHMSSMSAFNGDVLLAKRGINGSMYVLMGDVTGHGLTAAMGTLPVSMIFFKMASKGLAVGDIATELNRQLREVMPSGIFFAATLLELNAKGDMITVWMGGMPENYWLSKDGELKDLIHSQHMPLGVLHENEFDFSTQIFNVENDDKIYLYTDGVVEALSPEGELFGDERLKDILLNHSDNRFDEVLNSLKTFTDITSQDDDISLVELTCHELPAVDEVDEVEKDNESFILPWQTSITLSVNELRCVNPISELSQLLGSLPVLERHKGILQVLLSEMYYNALDHSILQLDSSKKTDDEHFTEYYKYREEQLENLKDGSIVFDFKFLPDTECPSLSIRIKDSGEGYQGHGDNKSGNELHGRGLSIISSFCEDVVFSDGGKVLEVLYPLR